MKPKIIEVKEPVFEEKKPPENILFSYTPSKTKQSKSFLSIIKNLLNFKK
jgi:hypothetical protein